MLLQNRNRIYAKFRTHLRCFSSRFTLESARARTRTTYCMIYAVKYMSLCSRKRCPQCHIHSTCFGRQKIPLCMVYVSLFIYICIRILSYALIVLDSWLLTAWLRGCWVDRVLAGASISRGRGFHYLFLLSGTIIRGTLKTPNSQLVTPISIKLQRPDGFD